MRRYTFATLDALSDRLAKGLLTLGTRPGEPVAVHTGQRPETTLAHLAIHKIGAVVMTLSQLCGPDTVEHCLADSEARIVITDPQAWSRVRGARQRFTDLEHVLMVGEPAAGERAFDDCLFYGLPARPPKADRRTRTARPGHVLHPLKGDRRGAGAGFRQARYRGVS